MRKPWMLVGGILVAIIGIAGLILPVIPGIALLILGGLMIRSSMTGEPMRFSGMRRSNSDPLPEPTDG